MNIIYSPGTRHKYGSMIDVIQHFSLLFCYLIILTLKSLNTASYITCLCNIKFTFHYIVLFSQLETCACMSEGFIKYKIFTHKIMQNLRFFMSSLC